MTRILIVDDEQGIRENLEVGLQSRGYETVSAKDGEEAITCALRNDPDIILLDVMMPKLDGLSVCKRLKALMGDFVPIIMVTAMGTTADKETGSDMGADDYLVKPFKIEELMARINSMLRIKSRHDKLKKESVTDFVTGVYNHRYLCSRLKEEYLKAQRTGSTLSCMMLDLDNFKSINDKKGHQFGDQVLRKVSKFLMGFVGKSDVVSRYGGDEFVVMLPGCPTDNAAALAEQIREGLEKQEFVEGDERFKVTCSIGVAGFPGGDIHDVDSFLSAMDRMLYTSKKNGRNVVSVHDGK